MNTHVLSSTPDAGLFSTLRGLGRSFSLALRYRDLVEMSDAQLAARGLSRDALSQHFIDELDRG
jgi:hypothetical protein